MRGHPRNSRATAQSLLYHGCRAKRSARSREAIREAIREATREANTPGVEPKGALGARCRLLLDDPHGAEARVHEEHRGECGFASRRIVRDVEVFHGRAPDEDSAPTQSVAVIKTQLRELIDEVGAPTQTVAIISGHHQWARTS